MAEIETIQGHVRYATFAAFLVENGGQELLLAMDVAPFGHIQDEDISAAYQHLATYQGLQDGDPLTVLGFRDQFGARQMILVVRILV